MSSIVKYQGNIEVPKERVNEFNRCVQKILWAGGIMSLSRVEMFGTTLSLISNPFPYPETDSWPSFSYFENELVRDICYDKKTAILRSRVFGERQSKDVAVACNLLYGFYTNDFEAVKVDGDFVDTKKHLGWLNYLLLDEKDPAKPLQWNSMIKPALQGLSERFPPVTTEEFLGVSNDSRAFWKDKRADDIHFSPAMSEWMQSLSNEWVEIVRETKCWARSKEYISKFVAALYHANAKYGNVFCFEDLFFEFIAHFHQEEYLAASELLQRLVERFWDAETGRESIKRYLAILENHQLREAVFGF